MTFTFYLHLLDKVLSDSNILTNVFVFGDYDYLVDF